MDKPVSILSTRPLSPQVIEEAAEKGIEIDEISFIHTSPLLTLEAQQEIEQALMQQALVVFTSMNAVEAVANELHGMRPQWTIYCIGPQTTQRVANYFGEENIKGTATYAEELAELIIAQEAPQLILFFCGTQRRDVLPTLLQNNDFDVMEIEVYQTIEVTQQIEKSYAGILFFSPSAVRSFFKTNKAGEHSLLFAIGKTTADEIKKYTAQQVIIAEEAEKDSLARQAMEYFYTTG